MLFGGLKGFLGLLRVEAVKESDFGGIPVAVRVEVVQGEEGGGVEVADVVFFCRQMLGSRAQLVLIDENVPAICIVAQSGSGFTSLALG